jgi:hypothetical protein
VNGYDLFSYQMPALLELSKRSSGSFIIVLNKADLLAESARLEIIAAIESKCHDLRGFCGCISCIARPRPRTRVVVRADGTEERGEIEVPPDISTLVSSVRLALDKGRAP